MVVEVDNSVLPFSEESLRDGKKVPGVEGGYEKLDGWYVEVDG
jgi:hypothetical protein